MSEDEFLRVALLCRPIDGKPTNGFERYSLNLYNGLCERGTEVYLPNQDASLPIPPSQSLLSPPYYDIMLPAQRILGGRMRADVFHAVADSHAVVFPWLKGKRVVTMHHVEQIPPESPAQWVYRAFYESGTALALKYADKVICISQQTKREVMEALDVPEEMIVVIPQAIPSLFRPLERGPTSIIGYLGALKKRKNVEFLIRAFSVIQERGLAPDARLHIYGDGPDRKRLTDIVTGLDLGDKVVFWGRLQEENILAAYNSFRVFAFPSVQEGFGFPILEAQACGVPVVYLKGAMMPEESVRCAIPCKDEEDMAATICRLMDDGPLRSKSVQKGLAYAATFSIKNMAESTARVYEELVSRG